MNDRLIRLDHLRFAAALMVMVWHFTPGYVGFDSHLALPVLAVLEEGHTGVAFFCVISGFIFAWLYKGKVAYGSFLARRVLRIFPLFFVILALAFFADKSWDQIQIIGLLTTLHKEGLRGYIGPGWTVLVEWQFYLVLPFMLLFIDRHGLKYVIGLWTLFLGLRLMVWMDKETVKDLAYMTIFGRADQFLAGIIAGRLCRELADDITPIIRWRSATLGTIGLTAIVAWSMYINARGGWLSYNANSIAWVFWPAVEALCYAAIVAGYVLAFPAPKTIVSRAISYLGRISYSMYLTHILVFSVIHKWRPFQPETWEGALGMFVLVGLPSVVAVSSLTYALIERPFIELGRQRAKADKLVTLPTKLAA